MLRVFRHYIPQLPLILFAGDLAVLVAAFHVPRLTEPGSPRARSSRGSCSWFCSSASSLNLGGLYDVRLPMGRRELLARLLTCQAVAGLLVAAVAFAIPSLRLGRGAFLQIGAAATLGLIAWRSAWIGPVLPPAHQDPGARARDRRDREGDRGPRRDGGAPVLDHRLPRRQPQRPGDRARALCPPGQDPGPAGPRRGDAARPGRRGPDEPARELPRQGPHRLPDARHPGRGLADLLREGDGQDPRHRPPPELADLLGRLRQDPTHRDRQAARGRGALARRARPRPARDGAGRRRRSSSSRGGRRSSASPASARTAVSSS